MLQSAAAQPHTLRWCTLACLVLLTGLPRAAAAAQSTKDTPGKPVQQNGPASSSHTVASLLPHTSSSNSSRSSSLSSSSTSEDAATQQPAADDQQQVLADGIHGSSVTLGSGSEEAGEANLEGGPGHVDTIGAEVAARPADELPSKYPVKGLIDVQAPIFSEQPGVLIPLAQVRSGIGNWLAALEAASSGTPLSDPMFVGTVFIPANEAFERVFPTLHKLQQQGKAASEVFANVSASGLALQLNSLTVPGPALTYEQLWPGRVLKTAGAGSLKVVRAGTPEVAAMLQHVPSGFTFSILEPDVQSGSAVGHIVDTLPSEEEVSQEAKPAQRAVQGAYRSAVRVLTDPALQLGSFAWFVQQAGLTELLSSSSDAFTLLVPHDKAFKNFIASLTPDVRRKLLVNASLADQLVSAHLVPGMALGSAALEALLPSGQLKTPQGSMAVLPAAREAADSRPASRAEAVTEAGQLKAPAARLESAAAGPSAAVARAPAAAGDVRELAAVPGQQTAAIAAVDAPGSSRRHPQVADAHIEVPNIVAGKAVVHVLDKVLVPPGLEQVLGVPASPGYTLTLAPAPLASSASSARATAGAWRAAATAAGAAVVALLAV